MTLPQPHIFPSLFLPVEAKWAAAKLVGVLLLTLVLPARSLGQTGPVESLIEQGQAAGADAGLMRTVATRAEKAGISPGSVAALLRPAVNLAEQDLPAALLFNKTLEGLSKHVPPDRMRTILTELRGNTEQAGALVSTWLSRPEVTRSVPGEQRAGPARNQLVEALAEAQVRDASRGNLRQFLDGLPGAVGERSLSLPRIAVAAGVLPDLSARANSPEAARELLHAALAAGYDAASLRQFPIALQQAQRGRERPAVAIARATTMAIRRGTPAPAVLGRLLGGNLPGRAVIPGLLEEPGTLPGLGKPPGPGTVPPGGYPPVDSDPTGDLPDTPVGETGQ